MDTPVDTSRRKKRRSLPKAILEQRVRPCLEQLVQYCHATQDPAKEARLLGEWLAGRIKFDLDCRIPKRGRKGKLAARFTVDKKGARTLRKELAETVKLPDPSTYTPPPPHSHEFKVLIAEQAIETTYREGLARGLSEKQARAPIVEAFDLSDDRVQKILKRLLSA